MYLILESSIKNFDGIYDLSVIVVKEDNRKRYTYHLNDGHLVNKIKWMISKSKKLHGTVMNILNKNNIVESTV